MSYKTDDIRTIALVGHEVSGKTSLADALLFKAKAVDRRGCVDEGTSVSDYDEQEKQLKYSIDSSLLHLDHNGKRIYLIDTPGKPEFIGQTVSAMHAVETALIVVNAAAGVQVNTRRLFNEAGKHDLERLCGLAAQADVYLICQCTILQRCHADLLLIMAHKLYGAKVQSARLKYPTFTKRIS